MEGKTKFGRIPPNRSNPKMGVQRQDNGETVRRRKIKPWPGNGKNSRRKEGRKEGGKKERLNCVLEGTSVYRWKRIKARPSKNVH
jgi:hypothetical protein